MKPSGRIRSAAQERALYGGLSPARFAAAIGGSDELVYSLERQGWFGWTKDERGHRVPECQDVSRPGSKRRHLKIHPNAVERWFKERALTDERKAS